MLHLCRALRVQVRLMRGELGGLPRFVEGGRALVEAFAAMPGQNGAQQPDRLVRVIGDAPAAHPGPVGDELVKIARGPAMRGGSGQKRRPRVGAMSTSPWWCVRVGAPAPCQGRGPGVWCLAARSA